MANLLAPVGFADVEPFWPALKRNPNNPLVPNKHRELAAFEDTFGATTDITPPALSGFWRASAADRGLPAAASVSPGRPLLLIRSSTSGVFATRTRDTDWVQHADDQEVVQAMQRNAGEVDFDTGICELQVLLCLDREARWETFLAVREMAHSAMVGRLLVLTTDVLGPTFRLLDFSLPTDEVPAGTPVAQIEIKREGPVADQRYKVEMLLDGEIRTTEGENYASALTRWTTERKQDPQVLGVKLPRDEPFQTCFNVINAVAWLGMHSFRFGG